MAIQFPSPEWTEGFEKKIKEDAVLKDLLKGWDATVCTLFLANPEIGLEEDLYLLIDVRGGVANWAKLVPKEEGEGADFTFAGKYDKWKRLLRKDLDPIKAVISGQMKLKGSLPSVVKYVKMIRKLVDDTTLLDPVFPDEYDDSSKLDEYKAYIKKFRAELGV